MSRRSVMSSTERDSRGEKRGRRFIVTSDRKRDEEEWSLVVVKIV
jgi:hypothetical protein